jgi:hypothetical protein
MEFAQLEGMLMKHQVSTSDSAFTTLKQLESKVGNMTSEQIGLIAQLIDRTVIARNQASKRKIIAAIEAVEL